MSRWGKRKDKGGFASDGDSDHVGAPAKKNAQKDSDDSDEIVVCDKNRRVKLRNFQGKVMVDIREFYYKDEKEMPGKKGNSLCKLLIKDYICHSIDLTMLKHLSNPTD